MRLKLALFGAALLAAAPASALFDSQSSNSSSNSSSNNGRVRERIVETYCEDGYCERTVSRRHYRDDGRSRRDREYRRRMR
jgi:hypothetical protein